MIRNVKEADAAALCGIYNHYVAHSLATFETELVSAETMARRVRQTTARFPWLVAETDPGIVGYAYATGWKPRQAYRYTVESTVYLAPQAVGMGTGGRLMKSLLERLESLGAHAVLAGIALPNTASVALHEKLGFSKVAHFRQTGWKFDQWVDVGYWEKILPPGTGSPASP